MYTKFYSVNNGRGYNGVCCAIIASLVTISGALAADNHAYEMIPGDTITTYTKSVSTKYYDPTTGVEVADEDRVDGVEYIAHTVGEFAADKKDINIANAEYGHGTEKTEVELHDGTKVVYNKDASAASSRNSISSNQGNLNKSYVGATYSSRTAAGAALALSSNSAYTIGDVTGDFVSNVFTNSNTSPSGGYGSMGGGAIYSKFGTIGNITGDFVNNGVITNVTSVGSVQHGGGAIYNGGTNQAGKPYATIKSITGNFIGNYVTGGAMADGGAIVNAANASIGDINGHFIKNFAEADITGGQARGGAIYSNASNFMNITGDFIENYAHAVKTAFGGALALTGGSTAGKITSDFIGNYAHATGGNAQGGAFYLNSVKDTTGMIYSTVDGINGIFANNYAMSDNGEATGGAIWNTGQIKGGITGGFYSNYAKSGAVTLNNSGGGAIWNDGAISGGITADFYENKVTATDSAFGGAIYNGYTATAATIDNIVGDFVGNSIYSEGRHAQGGAIYNGAKGTINSVQGAFANNTASNDSYNGYVYGGAVYNKGTIKSLNGLFLNNKVSSSDGAYAFGGAIYNEGKIENLTGVFIGNSTSADGWGNGGAIMNYLGGDLTFVGNNLFTDNETDGAGGAIYNYGQMTFDAGTYIFANNTANGERNDIYNGSTLNINSGASVFLDGGIKGSGGKLNIAQGATVYSGENSTIGNATNNSGTIVVGDGNTLNMTGALTMLEDSYMALGDNATLNISGNLTLNDGSMFALTMRHDADANPTTNLITVGGDIIGTAHVMATLVDETETVGKWTKFLVAENDDVTTASGFILDRVIGSPFEWQAELNTGGETSGSHWYMKIKEDESDPSSSGAGSLYVAEVPAYTALHQIAMEQTRGIVADVQRAMILEQKIHCHEGETCHFRPAERKSRLWLNATYNNATIKSPAKFDASITGATMGLDFYRDSVNQAGAFAAYRYGSYDLNGRGKHVSTFGTDITDNSTTGGLYYKYLRNNTNVYAMALVSGQQLRLQTHDHVIDADTNAMQYGMNIGLAQNYIVNSTFTLSPFADLSYVFLDIDKVHDNAGKTANAHNLNYFDVEAGLLMEYIPYSVKNIARLYFKPSVVQMFSHGGHTRITGIDAPIDTFSNHTLGRAEFGGEWHLRGTWNANALVGVTAGGNYTAFDASAGISVKF